MGLEAAPSPFNTPLLSVIFRACTVYRTVRYCPVSLLVRIPVYIQDPVQDSVQACWIRDQETGPARWFLSYAQPPGTRNLVEVIAFPVGILFKRELLCSSGDVSAQIYRNEYVIIGTAKYFTSLEI